MDKDLKNKIILGSQIKADKNAKITGKICNPEISLLKIILELRNSCSFDLSLEQEQDLDEKALHIQNKYASICKYRQTNITNKKFIN